VLELVVALALFIGPAQPQAPTIAFADSQHGWAGGGGGVFATIDGGATWRLQTTTPARELDSVDARHAWAISDQGVTARTTDGVHWATLGVQHLMRLSFVDATHGFALTRDDVVQRTTDGGLTWLQTGSPYRLQSVCFADARTGFAARDGTVWTTRDAGATWKPKTLRKANQGFPVPELACRGRDVWVVLHGGAAAGSEGYAVYGSSDAGATWRLKYAQFLARGPRLDAYAGPLAVVVGGAVLEGSCAPCDGAGTVSIVHGAIRKTFDGVRPGPLAFPDSSHGFAILTSARTGVPAVWRTTNGGRTWTRVLASKRLKP
jgi:photosystem II stability/assembly factor-like uncharacterized protein